MWRKAKGKHNYKVKMMTRYGEELNNESNNKRKWHNRNKEAKQEHIYELNGMTMEGKNEGKGSLWEMEFEMMSTPLGWWNDSNISVGSRHLRALKFSQDEIKRLRGQASLASHTKCAK